MNLEVENNAMLREIDMLTNGKSQRKLETQNNDIEIDGKNGLGQLIAEMQMQGGIMRTQKGNAVHV
jgi:hypothetical protein